MVRDFHPSDIRCKITQLSNKLSFFQRDQENISLKSHTKQFSVLDLQNNHFLILIVNYFKMSEDIFRFVVGITQDIDRGSTF